MAYLKLKKEQVEGIDPSVPYSEYDSLTDTRRVGYALFDKVSQHSELEFLVKNNNKKKIKNLLKIY